MEEDRKFKRRFKKSGGLRKNALMIHPFTIRFNERKEEFSQHMEQINALEQKQQKSNDNNKLLNVDHEEKNYLVQFLLNPQPTLMVLLKYMK